jgi:hypothetical protein
MQRAVPPRAVHRQPVQPSAVGAHPSRWVWEQPSARADNREETRRPGKVATNGLGRIGQADGHAEDAAVARPVDAVAEVRAPVLSGSVARA